MKRSDTPNPPYIDPSITDPAALKYKQDMEERGKYRSPVGGGPTPPIPRLDMPHNDGMTMADQARVQAPQGNPNMQVPAGIFQGMAQNPNLKPPPANILPSDLLPENAKQDPNFREGAGSMYASSQPELAYKYGVIRNKQHLAPQQLAGGTPGGLSAKTVADLEAVAAFQKVRQTAEDPETQDNARAEAAASAGAGGAAARIGQTDANTKPLTSDEKEKVNKAVQQMDDFDFHTFREMMMKDLLNNEEQKKLIESRLEALDITDLVMQGFVRQVVPIHPNKLEYEFQSVGGEEDLALKRLIVKEAAGFNVDDRYILDKYSIMSMAVGLHAVNKKPLPSHKDGTGKFDDDLFWVKYNMVQRLPLHMLASIGINFFWFDVRVRKLFVAEKLGNG